MMEMSKKVTTHPDIAHPRQSPETANYEKRIPAYSLFVKVARGVLQRCVGNNLRKWLVGAFK